MQNLNKPQGNAVEYSNDPARLQYGEDRCCVLPCDELPQPVAADPDPGVSDRYSRCDHVHDGVTLSDEDPLATGATDPGVGIYASRWDHVHEGMELSDEDPLADGVADPGVGITAARWDHVHPGGGGAAIAAYGSMVQDPLGDGEIVCTIADTWYPIVFAKEQTTGPYPPGPYSVEFVADPINGDYLQINTGILEDTDWLVAFSVSFFATNQGEPQVCNWRWQIQREGFSTDIQGQALSATSDPTQDVCVGGTGILTLADGDKIRLKVSRLSGLACSAFVIVHQVSVAYLGPHVAV